MTFESFICRERENAELCLIAIVENEFLTKQRDIS